MPTTNGHAVTTGLVLDGHFGWHNHKRMIDVACDLGFPLPESDRVVLDAYDSGEHNEDMTHEFVFEMMDEAEQWLNHNTPPVCTQCGEPVEWRPSGWFTHVGLRGQCSLRMSDTCQRYMWHWWEGDFMLSPWCGKEDGDPGCDDDTCICWIDA